MSNEQKVIRSATAQRIRHAELKSKTNTAILAAMIDDSLSDEDWERVLHDLVRGRNTRGAELLLRYRFSRYV